MRNEINIIRACVKLYDKNVINVKIIFKTFIFSFDNPNSEHYLVL